MEFSCLHTSTSTTNIISFVDVVKSYWRFLLFYLTEQLHITKSANNPNNINKRNNISSRCMHTRRLFLDKI